MSSSSSSSDTLPIWDSKWIPGQHSIAIIGSKDNAQNLLHSLISIALPHWLKEKEKMHISCADDYWPLPSKSVITNDDVMNDQLAELVCETVCQKQKQKIEQIIDTWKREINDEKKENSKTAHKKRIDRMKEQSALWIHFGAERPWISKMIQNARDLSISLAMITTDARTIQKVSQNPYDWYFVDVENQNVYSGLYIRSIFHADEFREWGLITHRENKKRAKSGLKPYWLVLSTRSPTAFWFTC